MNQSGFADALARRLGDQIGVGEERVGDTAGLIGAEPDAVANAIFKRQAEFAAGRRAARLALRHLNASEVAIPAGRDRAPIWPEGIVGSITHDAGRALSLVAKTSDVHALGIDLTEAAPLPGQTRNAILRPEEQDLTELEARAAFAVKESLFKALHPRVKVFFGFEAALVRPDLESGKYTVTLCADTGPYPEDSAYEGSLIIQDGCIVACIVVAA